MRVSGSAYMSGPRLPFLRCVRSSDVGTAARGSHGSASAKLFADAEKEEREEAEKASKPSQADILMNKHENWDGEERLQDTVLRMLVDKYKPLRTGQIQSADEKLKSNLPKLSNEPISQRTHTFDSTIRQSNDLSSSETAGLDRIASSELDEPSVSGKPVLPWLVTFKVPTHAQASIKVGNFVSSPPRTVTNASNPLLKTTSVDPQSARGRAERKAEKRFAEGAGRLDRARESTMDYRSGVYGHEGQPRLNPVSMRGWNALIEEKIQRAQATGAFDKLEGRGKPFRRTSDEMNPFVAREEFLMNRIVRKNDAAPPWVEFQKDAEKATEQMREIILSGWTRRAVRMLPLSNSTATLENLTAESASKLRDAEWERQEEKFHDAAIREANEAIRRYNTVAPYVVRRHLLTRESEMARCYANAGSLIVAGIQARISEGHVQPTRDEEGSVLTDTPLNIGRELRRMLSDAVSRVYARFSGVAPRHM
ncbi:hypothetical protein BDV93DRAFT_487688 [Ceratobasidium sp. AG-I]|nr:hypothetical protein BDV93DRAFT_487688 [Ceratobasidium sp. AG-I]